MSNSQENWININNRMPDDEESVLFLEPFSECLTGDLHLGFRLEGEWITKESNEIVKGYISHWLEIPDTTELINKMDS